MSELPLSGDHGKRMGEEYKDKQRVKAIKDKWKIREEERRKKLEWDGNVVVEYDEEEDETLTQEEFEMYKKLN